VLCGGVSDDFGVQSERLKRGRVEHVGRRKKTLKELFWEMERMRKHRGGKKITLFQIGRAKREKAQR